MISVLVADDSEIMRKAIAGLLKRDPEIQLLGEAVSFRQIMELTKELHPHVVVMDLHMGDENNVTPSDVKSCLSDCQLVAISIWNDVETKSLARRFGAVELLDKTNLFAELIPAIKRLTP